jgi:hypothetical protein
VVGGLGSIFTGYGGVFDRKIFHGYSIHSRWRGCCENLVRTCDRCI